MRSLFVLIALVMVLAHSSLRGEPSLSLQLPYTQIIDVNGGEIGATFQLTGAVEVDNGRVVLKGFAAEGEPNGSGPLAEVKIDPGLMSSLEMLFRERASFGIAQGLLIKQVTPTVLAGASTLVAQMASRFNATKLPLNLGDRKTKHFLTGLRLWVAEGVIVKITGLFISESRVHTLSQPGRLLQADDMQEEEHDLSAIVPMMNDLNPWRKLDWICSELQGVSRFSKETLFEFVPPGVSTDQWVSAKEADANAMLSQTILRTHAVPPSLYQSWPPACLTPVLAAAATTAAIYLGYQWLILK